MSEENGQIIVKETVPVAKSDARSTESEGSLASCSALGTLKVPDPDRVWRLALAALAPPNMIAVPNTAPTSVSQR